VLWALDLEVSYTKMTKAMQYLARGDAFLATNDDLTFPLQTKKAIGM
jgi:ribonucleotide monophosphatase NagD (HAD superfamily)